MLFERHAINAARGYARRFAPGTFAVSRVWEAITRSPFPVFRPKPLFYRQPVYYMSNALTIIPSGGVVRPPSYTQAFDYELELGFVLDRPLYNASPEAAISAIGAFVVLCDFSARDVQRAEMGSGFGPQKSKHFMTSMSNMAASAKPLLGRIGLLRAYVELNHQTVAVTSTQGMHFTIGEALAHASKDEHLFPGELFGTGTLPGGSGVENGHWLKSGDHLRLLIEGVGEIQHYVA